MPFQNPSNALIVRLKKSEPYSPPPEFGHGVNQERVQALIAVMESGRNVFILIEDQSVNDRYGQWLDILEASDHFQSRSGSIRIYRLHAYVRGDAAIQASLNSRKA